MQSKQRFTHVAVTVSREMFHADARAELLDFYGQVFGWYENPALAIRQERIFLRAPTDRQYLTIRASEAPMATSGYEHLGLEVESEQELRGIHERAQKLAGRYTDLELGDIRAEYDGALLTFKLRFRLPLSVEVLYLARPGVQR